MSSEASPSGSGAWAPYDTYKDCSQGICSIYCPQWCYIIFPPPPPTTADDNPGPTFSPLIIAVIGILASAFLLVSYYTIVTRYCRRGDSSREHHLDSEAARHHDELHHQDQWQLQAVSSAAGLDESIIKSITVFKYRKSDKLVEGTECAVCLNEFREEENLRLLPKCCHAFHLPCIDTWLKSQSNCPLCRANVNPYVNVPISPLPAAAPNPQPYSSAISVSSLSSLQIQRENDLVFVVEDLQAASNVSLCRVWDIDPRKDIHHDVQMGNSEERRNGVVDGDDDQESAATPLRRSFSLGAFSWQRNLLVADILRMDDDNDSHKLEGISDQSGIENIGSSKAMIRRSFSTGRFSLISMA